MLQFTQIKETCIYVKNLRKTMQFYQDLLGFEMISYVKESHIFFKVGSSVLLCFLNKSTRFQENSPRHHGFGNLHLAFEAPEFEYESLIQQVMDLDIEIKHNQVWDNGKRSFYFNDPDGHLLEVTEFGLWDN